MCDSNKTIPGIRLRFEISIELTLNSFLLQMLRFNVIEIDLCVYTVTVLKQ